MHSDEPKVRDVYYGVDDDSLYLRLDLDDGFQLNSLELHFEQKTVSLLNNPAVQFARKRVAEIRVPFSVLGLAKASPIAPAASDRTRSSRPGYSRLIRPARTTSGWNIYRAPKAIWLPAGGAGVLPITISLLVRADPYSSLFQSSSGRSVAPCSDMPAKMPRDRE